MKKIKVLMMLAAIAAVAALSGCSAEIPVSDSENALNGQGSLQQENQQNPGQQSQTGQSEGITADEAKTIALSHAGIDSSDVMFIQAQEDRDDGQSVYDVEFYAGNQEYDYEILKSTGDILSYDYNIEGYSQTQESRKISFHRRTEEKHAGKSQRSQRTEHTDLGGKGRRARDL